MEHTTVTCDIEDMEHEGKMARYKVPVMFDHDQADGKSKVSPYFETHALDMCEGCFVTMTKERLLIYVYGAMGHNKYYLNAVRNY